MKERKIFNYLNMKYIVGFILLVGFYSCQEKLQVKSGDLPMLIDISDVEYSATPQPLSDFVESIEYIKLSEEPLVTDVVLTRLSEDNNGNLYLDVPGGLFKYTPDGTFIKNLIKIGQGPNEITSKPVANSVFNFDKEFILINDNGRGYYQKISLDGDFLERTDRSIISNGEFLGRRDIYAYWKNFELYKWANRIGLPNQGEYVNRDSLYFFHIKDLNTGSDIYKMTNHHFHIKEKIIGNWYKHNSYPIYRGTLNNTTYWVKPLFVDTVYCTTDWTDVRPLYVIKKDKDAADYEWEMKLFAGDGNVTWNEIKNKDRLNYVMALENGILFSYLQELPDKTGAGFCPANGKTKAFSRLFKNDIDEYCPSLDFVKLMSSCSLYQKEGYIYASINAFKFFEEGAKPPFPDLTEDSNPVIVKLKLKKR